MSLLKDYIGLIANEQIRAEVERLIYKDECLACLKRPSSYTGDYHPKDEFREYGQLVHTLRVTNVAIQLFRSASSDRLHLDFVIAGALLHDVPTKFMEESGYANLTHAVDNAQWFLDNTLLPDEYKNAIVTCIINHMGIWETSKARLLEQYPPTPEAWVVHLADSLSSCRNISVDVEDIGYIRNKID